MSPIATDLAARTRPALLVGAARQAAQRLTQRLSEGAQSRRPRLRPGPELLEIEDKLDLARRSGMVGYSAQRHVMVLAALLVQARLP